ncbi:MAG: FAD-dependent oxidoreductase, partial [Desulfobacterales bacterium]
TAAHLLSRRHRVTLIEKNDWIGGHTKTVTVPSGPDAGTPVDVGFIVFNDRTYPLLNRLLAQLEVATAPSDMSFSYTCRQSGLQYATQSLDSLFAQRRNLLRPGFLVMLGSIIHFNRLVKVGFRRGELAGVSLEDFLNRHRFGLLFKTAYIFPMVAAIWSAKDMDAARFPMETFARFFFNHGLLSIRDQPQWRYIPGGSRTYVKAFLERFTGKVMTSTPVRSVKRTARGMAVRMPDGSRLHFDCGIIAVHGDDALQLLEDPGEDEKSILSAWTYAPNRVVLHTDTSWMPPSGRAWASWNSMREAESGPETPATLTYHMNRLQRLTARHDYCVTLNPSRSIPRERTVFDIGLTHPIFTFDAIDSQKRLPQLNGRGRTYFCGSYFGYGFHEDAVRSAVQVAEAFGISL